MNIYEEVKQHSPVKAREKLRRHQKISWVKLKLNKHCKIYGILQKQYSEKFIIINFYFQHKI